MLHPFVNSYPVYIFSWQSILQSCHFFCWPEGWKSLIFSLSSVLRFETVHTCTFIIRWLGMENVQARHMSIRHTSKVFILNLSLFRESLPPPQKKNCLFGIFWPNINRGSMKTFRSFFLNWKINTIKYTEMWQLTTEWNQCKFPWYFLTPRILTSYYATKK